MKFKLCFLGIGLVMFLGSSVGAEEIWGNFSKYQDKTKKVEMQNGAVYGINGGHLENYFFNLPKGTPLWMRVRAGKIQEARKIRQIVLDLRKCPVGALIEITKRGGFRIEGELIKKSDTEITISPVIGGKLKRHIKTTMGLSDLLRVKNPTYFSLPPSVKNPKNPKNKSNKPPKHVIELSPSSSSSPSVKVPSTTAPPRKGLAGMFRDWADKCPEFLKPVFIWASNNPPLFFVAILLLLWMIGSTIYRKIRKKMEDQSPKSFSPADKYKSQHSLVNRALFFMPQRVEMSSKSGTGGGHNIQLKVFMRPCSTSVSWDVIFFLFSEEKPREFRMSKNDVSLSSPQPGGPPITTQNLHLFTPSPNHQIFPIVVKASAVDRFRDAFLSDHLYVESDTEGKKYNQLFAMLTRALLAKNLPAENIQVDLVL